MPQSERFQYAIECGIRAAKIDGPLASALRVQGRTAKTAVVGSYIGCPANNVGLFPISEALSRWPEFSTIEIVDMRMWFADGYDKAMPDDLVSVFEVID